MQPQIAELGRKAIIAGPSQFAGSDAYLKDEELPTPKAQCGPEGAINIPLYFIRLKLDTLDPKKKYVVYCDTGRRSSAGAYILSERGFDVYVLKGGAPG